jgi:hypothetical protein
MGRTGSIPWQDIKNDYVNGTEVDGKRVYPSTTDLSKKYNVDRGQLGRKSSKEGWLEQRQILVNKISTRSQQKTIEQISNKGVDFDVKCFKQAQSIRELIENKITEELKPQEIALLVKALKDNQSYAKEALGEGIVQDDQKIVIEIVK